jgi:hypothetical protein
MLRMTKTLTASTLTMTAEMMTERSVGGIQLATPFFHCESALLCLKINFPMLAMCCWCDGCSW